MTAASVSPTVGRMDLGRDAKFEALLAEHGPMLRRIAGGYEADPEVRRELEQDILLAVWRALPRWRGEAPVRAFLARVAHNRAVTHVSREAARPRRSPLDEAMASDAHRPTTRSRPATCAHGWPTPCASCRWACASPPC